MKDREYVTTNGRAVFYASMWEDLRNAALDKGWALALHGSLASDMDIMAMPWVSDAAHVGEMIQSLVECFMDSERIVIETFTAPHSRKIYTLSIWGDFYLDINVIEQQ